MNNLIANITIDGVDVTKVAPTGTINRIDTNNANPVAAWESMGSPLYPTRSELEE